jgi:hypothetical protein
MQQANSNTATGQGSAAIAAAQPAPRVGDRVRIFDGFYCAYHWHVVTEIITGAHPRIKVAAYDCFVSASLVNGHRKGRK